MRIDNMIASRQAKVCDCVILPARIIWECDLVGVSIGVSIPIPRRLAAINQTRPYRSENSLGQSRAAGVGGIVIGNLNVPSCYLMGVTIRACDSLVSTVRQ